MTFPNAANGVKKLFIGEVLGLIAAIATASTIIFAQPTIVSDQVVEVGATGGTLGVLAVLITAAGVLAVLSCIFQLVGLFRASKDEEGFRAALYVILFSLLVNIAGTVLANLFPNSAFFTSIGTVVSNVAEFLATFLVIGTIGVLGMKLNDTALPERAGKLLGIIITVIILRLIANVVLLLFKESIAAFIVTIFGVIILILSVVKYVFYLSLLANAKNTLETR